MKEMQFAVPTLFGLEGLAGDELRRMNMENVRVEDRRVLFAGTEVDLAKANICLRTGERVMVVLAQFQAKTFEELFQGVLAANLEDYIPSDGQFPVKGHCLNSQLMPYFSPRRREAAFLMMAWQSETDMSWEFRQWPFTGNWPSLGMYSSRAAW